MMLAEWLVETQNRERDAYGKRSADLEEHDAKRQRGMRYLSSAQREIADVAEPRLARLKKSSVEAMVFMGHVLEEHGGFTAPSLFVGWARLFYVGDAAARAEAVKAFDKGMEVVDKSEECIVHLLGASDETHELTHDALLSQGEAPEPTQYDGWSRLFQHKDKAKRDAAHKAFNAAVCEAQRRFRAFNDPTPEQRRAWMRMPRDPWDRGTPPLEEEDDE